MQLVLIRNSRRIWFCVHTADRKNPIRGFKGSEGGPRIRFLGYAYCVIAHDDAVVHLFMKKTRTNGEEPMACI